MAVKWRDGMNKFWTILDAQLVGPFQTIVYLHIALAGIYGIFIATGTPQALDDSMSDLDNLLWLWMCPGVLLCLVGKMCRGDLIYGGSILQLTGDITAFGALTIFIVATIDTTKWGTPLFGVFALVALAECVALLIIRDIRRLYRVERRVRSWRA